MKTLFLMALALSVTACAQKQIAVQDPMDQKVREASIAIDVESAGAMVKDSDPYVVDELQDPAQFKPFVTEVCELPLKSKKWSKTQKADCDSKFNKMVDARWNERYPACNGPDVTQACDARPRECKALRDRETKIRSCHNAGVEASQAARHERLREIYSKYVAAEAQRRLAQDSADAAEAQRVSNEMAKGVRRAYGIPDATIKILPR